MKNILFILILFPALLFSQSVYYVETVEENASASDSNTGLDSTTNSWATLGHAFLTADAGDTVYMREGTWYPTSRVEHHYPTANNGTYSDHIVFMNYENETPILDCINYTDVGGNDEGIHFENSDYVELIGLTVTNCLQKVPNQYIVGVSLDFCGTMWVTNCVSHNHGGYGYQISTIDTMYYTNCDAFLCVDTMTGILDPETGLYSEAGNKADGFGGGTGGTAADTFKIVYYEGCRAWLISDDGFDIGSTKQLQMNNCWSFINKLLSAGGGSGIKLNTSNVFTPDKRKVKNCVVAYGTSGIYSTNLGTTGAISAFYNNVVYQAANAFSNSIGDFLCEDGPYRTYYGNNIAFGDQTTYRAPYHYCDIKDSTNTWERKDGWPYWDPNPAFTVTDDDFVYAMDSTTVVDMLLATRGEDNELPTTPFTLAEGSDLIDAGTDVGLSYNGSAPDIGAFESSYSGTTTTKRGKFNGKTLRYNGKVIKFE